MAEPVVAPEHLHAIPTAERMNLPAFPV